MVSSGMAGGARALGRSRQRLFLLLPSLIAGGAERVAMLLARGFVGMGHEVHVVIARKTGELSGALPPGVTLLDMACGKPIRGVAKLAALVQSYDVDACIAFGIQTGIAAALSKSRYCWRAQLVIRNENNLQAEWASAHGVNRWVGPLLSRWAARKYGVVCVSETLSAATQRYLRLDRERVFTILNPVFEDSTDTATPAQAGELHPWLLDRARPTFVAMGRLEFQKGFDVLLDAFQLLLTKMDARLVIFGNGSLRDSLSNRILAGKLESHVALPGYTAHPLAQMSAATAFVLSSRFEGFGLVLVEALKSGTQVVSTQCDYGPEEILERGKYGYLVEVGNAQALADAMAQSATTDRKPLPDKAWFDRFSASTAAARHIEYLDRKNVGK